MKQNLPKIQGAKNPQVRKFQLASVGIHWSPHHSLCPESVSDPPVITLRPGDRQQLQGAGFRASRWQLESNCRRKMKKKWRHYLWSENTLWSETMVLTEATFRKWQSFSLRTKSEYISLICFVDASKAGRVCFPVWICLSVSLFMSTSHTRVCIGRFVCIHMASHWSWGVRVLLFRRGTLEILHRARDRTLGHGLGF